MGLIMTTALCETKHDYEIRDGIITFDALTGKVAICEDNGDKDASTVSVSLTPELLDRRLL